MKDLRDLKIQLLKAQLDRALAYDPEWGDPPEARPLTFLVGAERRIQRKLENGPDTPEEAILKLVQEYFYRSWLESNLIYAGIHNTPEIKFPWKNVSVPIIFVPSSKSNSTKKGDPGPS